VSKVKQLLRSAHLDVLQALRNGEIRIHRAWLWSKNPWRNSARRWKGIEAKEA